MWKIAYQSLHPFTPIWLLVLKKENSAGFPALGIQFGHVNEKKTFIVNGDTDVSIVFNRIPDYSVRALLVVCSMISNVKD